MLWKDIDLHIFGNEDCTKLFVLRPMAFLGCNLDNSQPNTQFDVYSVSKDDNECMNALPKEQ